MAPWLAGKTFVVVPSADFPAPARVSGFWDSKVAAPRIANRFVLTMASEDFVGLTMMEQEPATPWVEGSTLSCFCACAEAKLRERENYKALILMGGPDEPNGACCPEEGHTHTEEGHTHTEEGHTHQNYCCKKNDKK